MRTSSAGVFSTNDSRSDPRYTSTAPSWKGEYTKHRTPCQWTDVLSRLIFMYSVSRPNILSGAAPSSQFWCVANPL